MSKPNKDGYKRDKAGRFLKGNLGGPGRPRNQRVRELRGTLAESVDESDIEQLATMLLDKSKAGDLDAVKLLFNRLFGPPVPADLLEKLEAMEATLQGMSTPPHRRTHPPDALQYHSA